MLWEPSKGAQERNTEGEDQVGRPEEVMSNLNLKDKYESVKVSTIREQWWWEKLSGGRPVCPEAQRPFFQYLQTVSCKVRNVTDAM